LYNAIWGPDLTTELWKSGPINQKLKVEWLILLSIMYDEELNSTLVYCLITNFLPLARPAKDLLFPESYGLG